MKIKFALSCLAISLLSACATTMSGFASMSLPTGFRDVSWGMNKSQIADIQYHHTDPSYGGIELYTRKNDNLTIGSAKIDKIFYGFWNDQLSSVSIFVKNYDNWAGLKNAAFEKYGRGSQSNRFIERYFWTGEMTTIMLDYNEISKVGNLWLSSKEISEQKEAWQKEKDKEGAAKGL